MNKLGKIVRIILLFVTIVLNIICLKVKLLGLTSWGHVFYLFLIMILLIITLKDLRKKKSLNNNNKYNYISIFIFIIMDYILLRTLLDTNLFFNNQTLIKEANYYEKIMYPEVTYNTYREFAMYYFKQNMIYFNSMLILLLSYRKMNIKKEKN